jgi:octopine/nopaline transport system substrate-binding protein
MPVMRVSLDDRAATAAMVEALTPYLKGKILGAQRATTQAEVLNTYLKDIVAEVRTYQVCRGCRALDTEYGRDLVTGRLDAALALPYLVPPSSDPGGGQLMAAGPLMTGGMLGHGFGVGLRKGDIDLKDRFDKAIGEAQDDGTLKRLTRQWLRIDASPPN